MLAGLSRRLKQAQHTSNTSLYCKSSDWAETKWSSIPRQSFFRFEAIYQETKRESTHCLSFTIQSHVFSHVPFSHCLVKQIVLGGENLVNIEIMRWAPKNPNLLSVILLSLVKLSGHTNSEWLCFSSFLGK